MNCLVPETKNSLLLFCYCHSSPYRTVGLGVFHHWTVTHTDRSEFRKKWKDVCVCVGGGWGGVINMEKERIVKVHKKSQSILLWPTAPSNGSNGFIFMVIKYFWVFYHATIPLDTAVNLYNKVGGRNVVFFSSVLRDDKATFIYLYIYKNFSWQGYELYQQLYVDDDTSSDPFQYL